MTPKTTLRIYWLGTSIMEHRQAYSPRLTDPTNLAQVGETVRIEEHRSNGYVRSVHLALQLAHPRVAFVCHNQGQGGATSRDLARAARSLSAGARFDLAVFGCGINDVWRAYQGRETEAVAIDEYAEHYTAILTVLATQARQIVCVSETPIRADADPQTAAAINEDLARYNRAAGRCAAAAGVPFIDVWTPFTETAHALAQHQHAQAPSLWSDGVHLSDLGVALLSQHVEAHLRDHRVVERLLAE
ncbi:SGNH/GDSL hydrolase family protein [Streptomyces lavendulae]|uniref:SGNH/GDSL hydrolase family protein n=1 Tax=Streptomyces lavendulae TaxID=1914 RepID=UPI0024A55305|nr:GDSL-type esterase/lipase family protein [Streptomyces lavendulae]GLX22477.1 hypothetical protein Slala01_61210 [Streptomyces lavendulae subsp. lavendulae]GLX29960.1 hypothetical protein Slala02_57800 [Streptomyces lavendulae subsp. lavendulae]